LDLDSGGSGGFSSSKDTANLISYILKNNMSLLSATAAPESKITSESNIVHVAKNTNQLSEKIPSLIASKTGFTDLAGGNLAISFEVGPSKPVIAVIMGSSIDGRFTDMEKVVNSTLQYYSNLDL
jgi:D-alanyl-D-alanine carboxypeptidase